MKSEIFLWIIKVIKSCVDTSQVILCGRLINSHYKLYKDRDMNDVLMKTAMKEMIFLAKFEIETIKNG